MRIGIDVGGTHTDAVLINNDVILSSNKSLTTSDVTTGVQNALDTLLVDAEIDASSIQSVMIGTTQFTNAVVERKHLCNVAAIRLAMPSGAELPPMIDWPEDLANVIGDNTFMINGGYLYDGWPVSDIDDEQVDNLIAQLIEKQLDNIAIASAFSPMNPEPEIDLADKILAKIPHARITLSHKLGSLGILERENAAILNSALLPLADQVVDAFIDALACRGMSCPMFISQNDGTLMNADFVRRFPALTFASGPTNSLRGACKLSGLQDAIVVDIGGTTSDIGVLIDGFPRESNSVIYVGGVRTNFRMPDIQAVPLGGGSLVSDDGKCVGPQSVGHQLLTRGLVFGGDTLTTSDIAVAAGYANMGRRDKVNDIPQATINHALNAMSSMLDKHIDMMKPNSESVPVILVGGGAVLVNDNISAASSLIRPEHSGVANAIGAAIAQVGGESESMLSYRTMSRQDALDIVTKQATQIAIDAGACPSSIVVSDIEETVIPYMDEGMTKIRIKVVGDVASLTPLNTDTHAKDQQQ